MCKDVNPVMEFEYTWTSNDVVHKDSLYGMSLYAFWSMQGALIIDNTLRCGHVGILKYCSQSDNSKQSTSLMHVTQNC